MGFEAAWKQAEAEYACDHPGTELRRLVASNGVVHFRRQCLRCGATGDSVRKSSIPPEEQAATREVDDELRATWDAAKRERARELQAENHAHDKQEWDEWYAEYLQSPEWARRRALVMERAGGVCEGCGLRPATQVHHTTYAHAGNELLFELRAVCRACHEVIHEVAREGDVSASDTHGR